MQIDISTLTVDNITAEIMQAMTPDQIAAFKSKVTEEDLMKLMDKMGGSSVPGRELTPEEIAELEGLNTVEEPNEAPQAESSAPTTQVGPITFGANNN